MASRLFLIAAAVAAAIVHASFLSALPHPLSAIDPRLVLVVALITSFRFGDAAVAAAAAGLAADALSPLPFGVHALVSLAAAGTATFLFTRVFTNHSLPGVLGVNACAYVFSSLAAALAGLAVAAVTVGLPPDPFGGGLVAAALGLVAHLTAVLVALVVLRRALRWFSTFFFVR